MYTWKRIGDDRYRISENWLWHKYDIELLEPLPKGWIIIGRLKKDKEQDPDCGIIDHVSAEGYGGIVAWLPCRVIKIYASV